MLDFIFRRGNPTNTWKRSPDLTLSAALDEPSLNGVGLGSRFNQLSSIGRSERTDFGYLCYFDLGIAVECGKDDELTGYMVVLNDEEGEFQAYGGTLNWNRRPLNPSQIHLENLDDVFGNRYWTDKDDHEFIAFYEYDGYEMQIELTLSGAIKRFTITNSPLLANPEQRESYGVDKPWPPRF